MRAWPPLACAVGGVERAELGRQTLARRRRELEEDVEEGGELWSGTEERVERGKHGQRRR